MDKVSMYTEGEAVSLWWLDTAPLCADRWLRLLRLGGKLLAERCRTWCQVSLSFAFLQAVWTPKFWGPNVFVYHSLSQVDLGRPAGLRQSGGDDTVVVLLWNWSSQVPEKPQPERLDFFRGCQAARDAPDCVICSVVYGIRKIFRKHQVSKASTAVNI